METKNTSRRDFVKNTTLLAGGLIAAPAISKATNYFSGAADTIKVALIGCGGRGTGAALQALLSKQNVFLNGLVKKEMSKPALMYPRKENSSVSMVT